MVVTLGQQSNVVWFDGIIIVYYYYLLNYVLTGRPGSSEVTS